MLDPTTSEPQPLPANLGGDLGVALSHPRPGVAVLAVRGEIDALTTPQLETGIDELLADPAERVVLDLTQVTFLASSGLAVLIRAAQLAGERAQRLRLVVATRAVRRPLQVTGSDQLFDLFDDLGAAIGDPV
ncbi:MAG TPA: STAS domain-containing protein [Pseudonocardia sp.]|nr:STAS domain-containing protein [Pseudonocardia sp.]